MRHPGQENQNAAGLRKFAGRFISGMQSRIGGAVNALSGRSAKTGPVLPAGISADLGRILRPQAAYRSRKPNGNASVSLGQQRVNRVGL
jgi:hypothetical protein